MIIPARRCIIRCFCSVCVLLSPPLVLYRESFPLCNVSRLSVLFLFNPLPLLSSYDPRPIDSVIFDTLLSVITEPDKETPLFIPDLWVVELEVIYHCDVVNEHSLLVSWILWFENMRIFSSIITTMK